jgi:hypothetical protein
MENNLTLDVLPKDGNRILEELSKGNIIVARSKNNFMYLQDGGAEYCLFSHVPGSPGGGRKTLPKNEKNTAVMRSFAGIADAIFLVEYNRDMDLFGVLASAEQGILSMFPGDDREADETVEFLVPQAKTENMEVSSDA